MSKQPKLLKLPEERTPYSKALHMTVIPPRFITAGKFGLRQILRKKQVDMTWNYRVVVKECQYNIHEVYYNDKGEPEFFTEDPVGPSG